MRIIIDSMIGLMLVGVLVGVLVLNHDRKQGAQDVALVQRALDRLNEQAAYHTAVQSAMAGHDTMLVHVQAGWFGDDPPINAMLEKGHPWIDLAPPGDLGTHPPDPVVMDKQQAGFWYNPTTGVFRARVLPASNEAKTLALYNQVNGTDLDAFEQIPDPARTPIAHIPGTTPVKQYASMANQTWSETKDTKQADDKLFDLRAVAQQQAEEQAQAQPRQADQPGSGTQPADKQPHPGADAPPASDEAAPDQADTQAQAESDPARPTLTK